MFGVIGDGGTVENLGLINVDINGGAYIGGITGDNYGVIRNCYVAGKVSGTSGYVGGIIGYNWSSGIVRNCYSTAIVSGNGNIGGIVGNNAMNGYIQNCVALNISITSTSMSNTAGRVVSNSGSTYVNNNYSSSSIILTVNGVVDDNNYQDDSKNGIRKTSVELNNQGFWTTASNWLTNGGATAWDFTSIWEWDTATNLPKLR